VIINNQNILRALDLIAIFVNDSTKGIPFPKGAKGMPMVDPLGRSCEAMENFKKLISHRKS